ncbi:adenosylmethionine decarboxylase [Chloroflexota bacterium]
MNTLGRHLLLDLKDCDRELLNDVEFLKGALVTAAEECGATVLSVNFNTFNPQGVSGVVIIAESHISVHTWPEYGYAAVDIFTCGTTVQPEKAAEVLIEKLGAGGHSLTEVQRGLTVTV